MISLTYLDTIDLFSAYCKQSKYWGLYLTIEDIEIEEFNEGYPLLLSNFDNSLSSLINYFYINSYALIIGESYEEIKELFNELSKSKCVYAVISSNEGILLDETE